MVKAKKEIQKGIFGGVNKVMKNLWCNSFLHEKNPTTLSSKAELNAGLQSFNVKYEGLGTMALLGNVKAGKIKSLTIKKANDVVGNRQAQIVDIKTNGKLDKSLSAGKISC